MVLGVPDALVAERLCQLGQRHARGECLARRLSPRERREIKDREPETAALAVPRGERIVGGAVLAGIRPSFSFPRTHGCHGGTGAPPPEASTPTGSRVRLVLLVEVNASALLASVVPGLGAGLRLAPDQSGVCIEVRLEE